MADGDWNIARDADGTVISKRSEFVDRHLILAISLIAYSDVIGCESTLYKSFSF